MVTALILISIKYENQKSDAGRELVSREGEADCKECFGNDCKCQYKNAQKVENKNVHFPMLYSSACVSKKDRFSLSRYDGPFIETICE